MAGEGSLSNLDVPTEPLPKKSGGEEEVQAEDGEDPRNTLQHLLSQVKPPKVSDCLADISFFLFMFLVQ